jgi:hypothetical protein
MSIPRLVTALVVPLLALPLWAVGQSPAAAAVASSDARASATDTDGDGLDDVTDGCPTVAAANPTGCPSASRTARLKRIKDTARLQAEVTSPVTSCSSRARIKLWLDRPDRTDKLLAVDASSRGRHRFKVSRGATYYVTVSPSYSPGQAECGGATSRKVRIPR